MDRNKAYFTPGGDACGFTMINLFPIISKPNTFHLFNRKESPLDHRSCDFRLRLWKYCLKIEGRYNCWYQIVSCKMLNLLEKMTSNQFCTIWIIPYEKDDGTWILFLKCSDERPLKLTESGGDRFNTIVSWSCKIKHSRWYLVRKKNQVKCHLTTKKQ